VLAGLELLGWIAQVQPNSRTAGSPGLQPSFPHRWDADTSQPPPYSTRTMNTSHHLSDSNLASAFQLIRTG